MASKETNEKIRELTEILRSDAYTSKDMLDCALSRFLEKNARGKYICNLSPHTNAFVQITKNKGRNMCGCFACRITCRNAIDVYTSFGGESFRDAVIDASEDFGLISCIDAQELRDGTVSKDTKIVPKPRVEQKPNYWYEQKEIDVTKANKIYRLFSNLNGYVGKPRLSKKHLEELVQKRKLSNDEIKEIGFFTFPTCDISHLVKEMKRYGLSENDLQYVPGFYFDKETGKYDYTHLKGEAYGIPIRDVDGNVSAIQIRFTGENVSLRYIWFSSKNAMLKEEAPDERYCFGNTPGTPFSIIRPNELKNKSVLITEGFFKAYTFAREYGCTAIAVQGVQNIAGIENEVEKLRKEGLGKNLMIAFDADMAVNDNVLKPALKLASKLSNMPEGTKEKLNMLCLGGNKDETLLVRNLKQESKEVGEYFNSVSNIYFLVWNMDMEKGIDDLILAGHKSEIRHLLVGEFFSKALRLLRTFDDMKNEIAERENIEFVKAYVSDETLKNLFFNIVLEVA